MKKYLTTGILLVLLFSCAAPQPDELQGTWAPAYVKVFSANIPGDKEPGIFGGPWQAMEIEGSTITIRNFKNDMLDIEDREERFDFDYEDHKLLIHNHSDVDTIYIVSLSNDTLIIKHSRNQLSEHVFYKVKEKSAVFPQINSGAYALIFPHLTDTLLFTENGRVVHLNDHHFRNGHSNVWSVAEFDSLWFFNVEGQFDEPLLVLSVEGDTVHLKSGASTTTGRLIPLKTSTLRESLTGKWKQTYTTDKNEFLPFTYFESGFCPAETLAVLDFVNDSVKIARHCNSIAYPLHNRVLGNLVLFETVYQRAHRFNTWRVRFLSENEMEITLFTPENEYVQNVARFRRMEE